MTFRRTFQWLLTLVLFSALALGGYGWWVWEQRDLLLQATINEKLPALLPGWNVKIGRVHFDWYRRIRIHDIVLRTEGREAPLVTLPELIVTVDREALTQSQQVILQKVKLAAPVIELVRDAAGHWNFQDIPPLKPTGKALPEWEIEQGSVRVRIEQPSAEPTVVTLHHVDVKMIPSGKRAYVVKAATNVHQAGMLTLDGRFDLEEKSWAVSGRIRDVKTWGELLTLASRASPELRTNLARLERTLDKLKEKITTADATEDDPHIAHVSGDALTDTVVTNVPLVVGANEPLDRRVQLLPHPGPTLESVPGREPRPSGPGPWNGGGPASGPGGAAEPPVPDPEVPPGYVPDFGVTGTLDIGFQLDQPQPGRVPDFHLDVALREGQIANDLLPFPLHDLQGEFEWDNQHLILKTLSAKNGKTRLGFGGRIDRVNGTAPGRFGVRIMDLPLDERVRGRLPAGLRRLYDSLQPTGVVDVEGSLAYDGQTKWKPQDFVVKARDGSAAHVKFPYRVTEAAGTIVQKGNELDVQFEGRAGQRPVIVQGVVKNPGPENEVILDVFVRQLPLDDTLLAALPAQVQAPIRTLNLRGLGDGEARLYRPPGLNQKMQLFISGNVTRATFEYLHFPYRLTSLSGHVEYSSPEELWTFTKLTAEHGEARLEGEGSFSRKTPPGALELTVHAAGAAMDQQLNLALPDKLRRVWDDLSPQGTIKSLTTTIHWEPGSPADIRLPEIQVTRGSLLAKAFPYAMDDADAKMSWADGLLKIESFAAHHEDTDIRAKGFVETLPEGDWRLQLTRFTVDDLPPDRMFRRALPKSLKSIVDQIDPQGPISASGFMELRGTGDPRDPVTSAWDVEAVLTNATLNAGVTLKSVHGRVTSRGQFDGAIADFSGRVDLDSLIALDHQFTQVRGPYSLNDTQLIVGSAEALLPDRRPRNDRPVSGDQRLTGRFIGGVVTLDAAAAFNQNTVYDAKLALSQGRLEDYAARYLSGASNLRGTMNGWLTLHGEGTSTQNLTGRGALQISPAALYELPIMVQVFRTLSFTPPDKTAFRYAHTNFTLAREQFNFSEIDLAGESISLRGRGTAGFDGKLNLDFYSMMPKSGLGNIPLLNIVAREATKGWVGVEVSGYVSNPHARVKAVPQLDDAIKRFLGAFNPAQAAPRLQIPGFGY